MLSPIFRKILFPFAVLYHGITALRNFLYDQNIKKSYSPQSIFLINVGNLAVGGTGKTPHTEWLLSHFAKKYTTATLSRGYGRKTKGFLLAKEGLSAQEIGDEPMQFFIKYYPLIQVVVGEKRAEAIQKIEQIFPAIRLIILDDAFQHRPIQADFQLLISDYNAIFYEDFLMPTGLLRESRKGARRSNAVIISKCPANLSEEEKRKIREKIYPYIYPQTPILFTKIQYDNPYSPFGKAWDFQYKKCCIWAGIANPKPLEHFLEEKYAILKHWYFADHHDYTPQDVENIKRQFEEYAQDVEVCIFTTEKDLSKLNSPLLRPLIEALPLWICPITVSFLDTQDEKAILEKIEQKMLMKYRQA